MKAGRLVDFAVATRGRAPRLVHVCESFSDPPTRKRENVAMEEAMTQLAVAEATIVTRNESERIASGDRLIQAIPIWRFLLDTPDAAQPSTPPA